jgi:predicted metal-dependent hydrolase
MTRNPTQPKASSKPTADEIETELLMLDASDGPQMFAVGLRRSRRTSRLKLVVRGDASIELIVPWNCRYETAREFARQQGAWVAAKLKKIKQRPSLLDYLGRRPWLSADHMWWPVHLSAVGLRPGYQWEHDSSGTRASIRLQFAGDHRNGLSLALRKFARPTLERRTLSLADYTEIEPPRVQVRDQTSRWGSCSAHRTISLNWRLVLLPPKLQDYVIYHELAHLSEMNHKPTFWKLLCQYDRRAREHDRQLSREGAAIFQLGRER